MRSRVRRARRWGRSHPRTADLLLAVGLFVAALVSARVTIDLFRTDPSYRAPAWGGVVAVLAALVLPIALRRRFPLAVLVTGTVAFVVLGVVMGPGTEQTFTAVVLSAAFYSAGAYGSARRGPSVVAACILVLSGYVVYALESLPGSLSLLYVIFAAIGNATLFWALWALGRRGRELLERTLELEREREANARRAVFEERVRIARELHDVVAHHVSTMGLQAGAARLLIDHDRDRVLQALSVIEQSSREAVTELHRLLGFLRQAGETDELAPQPGLGQLPRLARSLGESQLEVIIHVEGAERRLPPTIDTSAYRIVQEALTNTLKHACASRADVHLRYRADALEVEVLDDGRGSNGVRGSGLGLIGMRERAALHGGEVAAAPTAGGGFLVRARLPTPA